MHVCWIQPTFWKQHSNLVSAMSITFNNKQNKWKLVLIRHNQVKTLILDLHRGMNTDFWFWDFLHGAQGEFPR